MSKDRRAGRARKGKAKARGKRRHRQRSAEREDREGGDCKHVALNGGEQEQTDARSSPHAVDEPDPVGLQAGSRRVRVESRAAVNPAPPPHRSRSDSRTITKPTLVSAALCTGSGR